MRTWRGRVGSTRVLRTAACFSSPPHAKVRVSPRFFHDGPDLAAPIDQPRQNRGQLYCWPLEEWGVGGVRALWSGDRPQAEGPGVRWVERSPSTFRLLLDGHAEAATIAINSRFEAGWRTDLGTLESSGRGLRLRVPAGRREVHLRHWPRTMTMGIVLSTLGLLGALVFLHLRSPTSATGTPSAHGRRMREG